MGIATERQIEAALRAKDGVIAHAAAKLKMTRQSLWKRVQDSAYLQAVRQEIEETMLDYGEGHITKGVRAGDKDYVRLLMMSGKGRKRGYGNTVTVGADDATAAAIIAALGGDPAKYRDALIQLGVNQSEVPA